MQIRTFYVYVLKKKESKNLIIENYYLVKRVMKEKKTMYINILRSI